jgi:hypothetical protein
MLLVACGGTDSTLGDAGNGDSGNNGDATSNNDGQTNNDGSTTNDGTPNDVNNNPNTIPCGNTSCTNGQSCCVATNNQQTTYTCAATCPQNTTTLKCIGNDCGSQVCCVYIDENQNVASQCQASCGQNEAQLCQNTDAAPTGCSSNQPCSSQNIQDWGLNPPFGTCGGKGN